jgi:glucose/arabinose dehydrogenase
MIRHRICHGMALVLIGAWMMPARADVSGMQEVAAMLDNPVFVTHAPGDRDRLFIIEEGGVIKILDLNTGTLNATPFLTIPNVDVATEGGLLGFAFHPQYSTPGVGGFGKFYVYATIDDNTQAEPFDSRIREYTVSTTDPNVANPAPREILIVQQPQANHNGGWIGFSPSDNPHNLYINFGDGGGDDDNDTGHTPGIGNSQDTTLNLLGKTLRIDISGGDSFPETTKNYTIPATNPFKAGVGIPGDDIGDDEIWAYGLRNPFRASFDRLTGDMWIGDVGQVNREEIDFQPASSTGGANYGWRLREGDIATPTPEADPVGGDEPADHVDPHYVYTRGTGTFQGFTVIGGYVYRGPDPELQGQYFFADAGSRHVWRFVDRTNPLGTRQNINSLLGALYSQLGQPVSFGEDAKGNLYLVDYGSTTSATGQIFRIVTDTLLAGDYNADGEVDQLDFQEWKSNYGAMNKPLIDGNQDGTVNSADYVVWRNNLGSSVHDLGAGTSVPEPTTLILCLSPGILLATARRFRPRRTLL